MGGGSGPGNFWGAVGVWEARASGIATEISCVLISTHIAPRKVAANRRIFVNGGLGGRKQEALPSTSFPCTIYVCMYVLL